METVSQPYINLSGISRLQLPLNGHEDVRRWIADEGLIRRVFNLTGRKFAGSIVRLVSSTPSDIVGGTVTNGTSSFLVLFQTILNRGVVVVVLMEKLYGIIPLMYHYCTCVLD